MEAGHSTWRQRPEKGEGEWEKKKKKKNQMEKKRVIGRVDLWHRGAGTTGAAGSDAERTLTVGEWTERPARAKPTPAHRCRRARRRGGGSRG